ncbi:hypothetical protein DE146DRAFT_760720 [Phaeosphaeria sp. MPI-PUGE-AT-0046c]|nr:hypothetical protein DE146DRAFT_760720 [Phaeosphaeria sp. MPI-PUGE-AT-0046c]
MAAPTIFEDVAQDLALDGMDQLFAGRKFWVAQRVPLRNQLLDNITANGGEVVKLEKKADYLIADHFRPKLCPPGSISYTFIDKSIKDGQLHDPQDHLAGPPLGEAREPGAIDRPTKFGRTPFTAEDDNVLYKWVRDCMARGMLPNGNSMYEELEKVNARHTWQSWRDRYIKKLQLRDPSSFNLPTDATQSPTPPAQPTVAGPKQAPSQVSGQGKIRATKTDAPPDYTIEQLNATFSAEDWEELYAAVEHIDNTGGKERDTAWERWAETQDNQTVEQWRQYYEKVVRPSWLSDPVEKREHIRAKVEKRRNESAGSQQEDAKEEAEPPEEPTINEHRYNQATAEVQATRPNKPTSDVQLMSSSTAQYESPKYISNLYPNALKRVRGAEAEQEELHGNNTQVQPRPLKRQKSQSPTRDDLNHPSVVQDTNKHTIEVFSSESGSSEDEVENAQVNEQIMQDIERSQRVAKVIDDAEEMDEEVESIESIETNDLLEFDQGTPPSEGLGEVSDDELPPNTPTPRASRRPPRSNFDTQAILSSPSQGIGIGRLPRPVGLTQVLHDEPARSSSLAPHAESDASTTQSLQEFRHSLNDEDIAQPAYPTLPAPGRGPSSSPTPSDNSNTSGDPDLPLTAAEMDDFFAEAMEEGFHNDFIIKALMRTRFRPELAKEVLEAWRKGRPLPDQRGIWSLEDDEAVESGDGLALAKLQKKHTLDGWGGITERIRFLEGYRSR